MSRPRDPDYFKKYRAAHPDYAARDRARLRVRRTRAPRGDRRAEYDKRNAARPSRAAEPLAPLYPETQVGKAVAYWEDELRLDLEQERHLACLEGRDPVEAVRAYRAREMGWYLRLGYLPDER